MATNQPYSTPAFTPSELAAIDAVISRMQAEGIQPGQTVPLADRIFDAMVRFIAATAARVGCLHVPSDGPKLDQIMEIAATLQSTTTLNDLIELRSRAVRAMEARIRQDRA